MKIYDLKYNAKAPEGIESRKAYIIGGGIAGLSAAVYLTDDIHMPGENITVLESLKAIGDSMDGTGDHKTGYLCRGEREMEPQMECLWNICSKVPSLRNPGRTVLDDVWDYNYNHPLHNEYRLVVEGKAIPCHDFSMDEDCMQALLKVLFCDEKELEGKTIADVFPESFFHANLWHTFHTALSAQSDALTSGAYSVFEQLCSQAETQLNARLTANGMDTVTITPENYSEVLLGVLAQMDADTVYQQAYDAALTQVTSEVEAQADTLYAGYISANADAIYREYVTSNSDSICLAYVSSLSDTEKKQTYAAAAYQAVMQQMMAAGQSQEEAQAYLATAEGQALVTQTAANMSDEQKQTALSAYAQSLTDEQKSQILAGAVAALTEEEKSQILAGALASLTDEQKTQIRNAYIARMMASDEVTGQINAAVASVSDAAVQVSSLKGQLDSYKALYDGLCSYTAGVDSAADGAADIRDGAFELSEGLDSAQTGAKELYGGLTAIQNGSASLLSGAISLHNGVVELQNGIVQLSDGTTELLEGAIDLKDGVFSLYDGTVELKDGVISLLDGTIELYDGTVKLYDGTVELTDGTFEFKDKTSDLKNDLTEKIKEVIDDILGGDFDVVSFVSENNVNVEEVQFVIKTPAIEIEDEAAIEVEETQTMNFWQKLLNLFGLYD